MKKRILRIATILITTITIGCATNCPTKRKKQRLLGEMKTLVITAKTEREDPKLVKQLNQKKLTKEEEEKLMAALNALIKGHEAIESESTKNQKEEK
ncbi:MAG: hypothetical protein CL677_06375 [Bdellovibrionaceae bacterium]|nr:hypothetical protein [Pseudobdellovibrionaceae bacterium]|tara:strand:- start:1013 stop:1303 length:291 start_codon:yes stop_codon:yes gene_type:complete